MEDDRKRTRLRKSLQLYLSRTLKKIPPIHIPSSAIPANITSARLLSTCSADDNSKDQAATLSDVDRFLFDNFRSLYIHDNNDPSLSVGTSTSVVNGTPPTSETSSSSESASEDIKEARSGEEGGDSATIVVFTMDPYTDFRRSMQNMIKLHHGCVCQPLDWDFLEELLFFYLQLNDKAMHKHILRAFADLTAGTHMSSSTPGNAQWANKSLRSRKNH
ncbi:unnamed protein product [Miscanthus lutarioriparius]|uniref:Transcription repressor n=1 Tax=Miscanthus lutarioriparius TaxID=422564 RepID=A0A811PDQ5_9POAL|nr:unnamed protein product [Miscanthus lutarioriparius]